MYQPIHILDQLNSRMYCLLYQSIAALSIYQPPWLNDKTHIWSYADTNPNGIASRVVFGSIKPPDQYELAFVPRNAEVLGLMAPTLTPSSNSPDTPTLLSSHRCFMSSLFTPAGPKLSSSVNLVKGMASLLQSLYTSFTLVRTDDGQLKKYGFAAPGLTVVPYAVMSTLNLMANLVAPHYPTLYLVRSKVMEEAERRTGLPFPYVVGEVVDKSDTNNIVKKGWSEIAGSFKNDDRLLSVSRSAEKDDRLLSISRSGEEDDRLLSISRSAEEDDRPLSISYSAETNDRLLSVSRSAEDDRPLSISHSAEENDRFLSVSRLAEDDDNIEIHQGSDSHQRIYVPSCPRFRRKDDSQSSPLRQFIESDRSRLDFPHGRPASTDREQSFSRPGECDGLPGIIIFLAELFIMLGLSNFNGRQSTVAQKASTITWLVAGLIGEYISYFWNPHSMSPTASRLLICYFMVLCCVLPIGGFVAVFQMLKVYGICHRFV
jgi:hypothetical protein